MTPNLYAPLLNHLWQSTLFGLVVALVALMLRRYRPEVRFWLWLMASLKFLFPLALLIDLGGLVHLPITGVPQRAQSTAQAIIAPTPTTVPFLEHTTVPAASHFSLWPWAIAGLWLTGICVVAFSWGCDWRAMRRLARAAEPLDLGLPIHTVLSKSGVELGVFGIFRPILMVPAGLLGCVTAEQLKAILEHELCHVRRHDNLWSALHQVTRALFWFHPLIWWAGARMAAERELICDEYALRCGTHPLDYAESILRVCRLYSQTPACVAGISGADLKERVIRIADGTFGTAMGLRMRFVLGGLIALCLILPFAVGAIGAGSGNRRQSSASNQAQSGAVSYGAASIRPSAPAERNSGIRPGPGGGLRLVNDTTSFLIAWAYNVQEYQVAGAPGWASSKRYDITFTAGEAVSTNSSHQLDAAQVAQFDQQRTRVQQILRDRFHLELHKETRTLPVYELETLKPKLKAANTGEGTSFQMSMRKPGQVVATAVPMTLLTQFLSGLLRRPVNDATGLTGMYDFTLAYDPASVQMRPTPEPLGAGAGLPSIFVAIHDQLGLKLESKKGPVTILVIDKLDEPTPN